MEAAVVGPVSRSTGSDSLGRVVLYREIGRKQLEEAWADQEREVGLAPLAPCATNFTRNALTTELPSSPDGLLYTSIAFRQKGDPRGRRRRGEGVVAFTAESCSCLPISTRCGTAKMKDFSAA